MNKKKIDVYSLIKREVEKLKKPENVRGAGPLSILRPEEAVCEFFSLRGRFFEKTGFLGTRNRIGGSAETESQPAGQTLGTVRVLSGLRS